MRRYSDVDVLAIDDLGKENPTEWAMSELYTIINFRYENKRPTIINTQYTGKELIAKWAKATGDNYTGSAILSRFADCCIVHDLGDVDRRTAT
jgi:DNA replication protein DnaC